MKSKPSKIIFVLESQQSSLFQIQTKTEWPALPYKDEYDNLKTGDEIELNWKFSDTFRANQSFIITCVDRNWDLADYTKMAVVMLKPLVVSIAK